MCGRFVQTNTTILRLQTLLPFDTTNENYSSEQLGSYNISPQKTVAVLNCRDEMLLLEQMRWGITPKWASQSFRQIINARSESIYEKPTFFSLRGNRILIPADGFYEWKKLMGGSSQKAKAPYFFERADGNPMLIAALFEKSADPITGEIRRRFVILTTEANEAMSEYHDRMPVIIENSQLSTWFDSSFGKQDLTNLTSLMPNDLLTARRVGNMINSSTTEGPELIEPVSPIAQVTQSLFDDSDC